MLLSIPYVYMSYSYVLFIRKYNQWHMFLLSGKINEFLNIVPDSGNTVRFHSEVSL